MIRQENQCSGKLRYNSKEEANKSARQLNSLSKRARRVSTYRCPQCLKYHTGHASKGKKMSKYKQIKNKTINHNHIPGIYLVDLGQIKNK